ncbi:hypothetical protein C8Q76DRAFT_692571 [Earliella scabrosa]|nr:hypothetical protein C8Q76DRAFT_692571 [Earliella scabrosa]
MSALKSWGDVWTLMMLKAPEPIIMVKCWMYSSALGTKLRLEEEHQQQFKCMAEDEYKRCVDDIKIMQAWAVQRLSTQFYAVVPVVVTLMAIVLLLCEWVRVPRWLTMMGGCIIIIGCFRVVLDYARLEVN